MAMSKRYHEIRDPIHTFVRLDSDEREVLDSPPVQRLRHIHQLGLSHLVYPGATHKRFEHSLGVMELAGRVFDVITKEENIRHDSVRSIIPNKDGPRYWRRVIRMAALCHDVGHLPFSHAAERELLPDGWDHERLTVEIIRHESMQKLWNAMTPSLRWMDIAKLAVGPRKFSRYVKKRAKETRFSDWEEILAEVIVGDAFGVDRMDYLLRDSHHAGVAYGRFDHYRLIDTLRILPKSYEDSEEPALGVEEGGLHSAEALLLARYFMYTQVYFHPACRSYGVHLKDFLSAWLQTRPDGGKFSTAINEHLTITDNEIMAEIRAAAADKKRPGHDAARRVVEHDHYRLLYQLSPADAQTNPQAAESIFKAACEKFGNDNVRRDHRSSKDKGPVFPVSTQDGQDSQGRRVESSLKVSQVLRQIPATAFDYVFVCRDKKDEATKWLAENKAQMIQPTDTEVPHGSTEA